jgi:hypothetical protein
MISSLSFNNASLKVFTTYYLYKYSDYGRLSHVPKWILASSTFAFVEFYKGLEKQYIYFNLITQLVTLIKELMLSKIK